MKHIGRKGLAILAMLIMILITTRIPVYGAGANVTIAVSQSSLKIGDTVSVTVSIATDGAIGAYSMAVTYDPSVLEYTGGSGNGGGGTVMIAGYGDGSAARLSASLNFRAVGNGNSAIATSGGEVYDWNENVLAISHAGTTVTVSAPQSPGADAPGGNGTSATDTPLSGSGDNTLKSLEISPGMLTPAFQSGITSYSVELPEDTKEIVVSAVPNDSKAKVAVSHNNDLEPGMNKTYIVVTAENGTQRTYTLAVQCGEVEDASKVPPIAIDGKEYKVVSAEEIDTEQIPAGYTAGEEDYKGEKLPVFRSPNQLLLIVYLADEEENGQWFIYEKETESFTPYLEVLAAANRFVFRTPEEEQSVPSGFTVQEVEIKGQKIQGYVNPALPDFVLVYAMNINGEQGFYLYDTVEDTFQRYISMGESAFEEPVTTAAETEGGTESEAITDEVKLHNFRILLYGLCGLTIGLLGLVVGMQVYYKRREKERDGSVDTYMEEDLQLKTEEKRSDTQSEDTQAQ